MKIFEASDREKEWAKNKPWPVYAVLFLVIAYVGIKQVVNPTWQPIIDVINFGIHELGHPAFSLFGDFMHALGGTIFEIGVPLLAIFALREQRLYFASATAAVWLTTALYSVSVYASDARALALPLASISGEVSSSAHDWNYMLGRLGWLEYDQFVGQVFAFFGIVAAAYAIFRGLKLLSLIIREKNSEQEEKQSS